MKEQKLSKREFSILVFNARENIRKQLILSNPHIAFNPEGLENKINLLLKDMAPETYKIYIENLDFIINEINLYKQELLKKNS